MTTRIESVRLGKRAMRLLAAVVAALTIGMTSFFWIAGTASSAQPPDGKTIFRFDTFGDEQLWTNVLRMHEAIAEVSPAVALKVGLKVDVEALPAALIELLQAKKVDLDDPAITTQLIALNAVVGVVGKVSDAGQLQSIGITCALCHSTVDDSFAPGIGRRLDGWANRSLNVGAIVALSPALGANLKAQLSKWGPGKYDPRHHIFDGKQIVPLNNTSLPVVIPSIFGLQGVGFETFTGDGPISYWNSYVGISQMGGQGNFHDQRIGVTIVQQPDLVTPKLPALLAYQLSLPTPAAPTQGINQAARARGEALFNGAAGCASCHVPPLYTDVMNNPAASTPFLHTPAEVGQNPRYAQATATKRYRTTPLRALWQHPPYFHDGSAADLRAVVDHYDRVLHLKLTAPQKADLEEFLKTL
jgi:hypothetical protein